MLLLPLLVVLPLFAWSAQITTVTPDVLANLKLFAQYSGLAYCSNSYEDLYHGSITCPSTVCPQLQNSSVEIVRSFKNVLDPETTGLVMLDHQRQRIVVSFRGTVSDVNWQTNLDFVLKDASDICKDCYAHSGFLDSWTGVEYIVMNATKTAQSQHSGYQTVVTGHSLGGALANLCAAKLSANSTKGAVSLYTYGSPRVGDDILADFIESSLGLNNFRVTHLNDPVPRLPGRLLAFRHAYPEYHITSPHIANALSADKATLTKPANLVVNATDVLVLSREQGEDGNLGYSCTNIDMHDEYFVPIADCVASGHSPLLGSFVQQICTVLDLCCNRVIDTWFGLWSDVKDQ